MVQTSRDCSPNYDFVMNPQPSTFQYNNQQQSIPIHFSVRKPKVRRIRLTQPSRCTGDNLVKIALNYHSQPDPRIPTIFVCNIRTIVPKIDELECVVNQNDSDIVCITETWLSDEIPDNAIAMHGFTLFRKDRGRRGGGVAIFVKSNIQCKKLLVSDIPESVTEILWLQMRPCRLPRAVSSILIAVVYHPPHASADDNYKVYNHIQSVVDSHLACHPDSLICIVGDFNPNSTNISSSRFRQLCGLVQIVKIFTRDSGILDWCLTNKPKIMSEPEKLPKIGSSDHYCFVVRQKLPRAKPLPKETILRRDTRDSRIREFGRWITSFSWQEVLSKGSCQDKFECFHRILLGAVEKYLPMKTIRKCSSDKPWMTNKIKSWIKKRQICMAKYGKDSSSFKFWRNKVVNSIKECKKSYYKSKVRNLKGTDASKWWREVKNLSGMTDRNNKWFEHLIDGETVDSVITLCERINLFFVNLTKDFAPLSQDDVSSYLTDDSGSVDDLLASTGEVYKSLCSLKTGKAPGPDGIPNVILKTFAFELAPVIADIYNSSLRDAYLPPLLKRAVVTPLPKQSPPGSIENGIRPISLTCQIAKVMEGLTLTRILPPIISHLDKKQFAMAGKSTQQAIVYILHLVLEALDRDGCTLRLFFADFRKGFDLIDHKILLDKLSKLGIHNVVLGWIAAFLYKRSQFVRIGSDASSLQYINGGIPQGTKLGPILFAVMVNELLSAWGPRVKFVDDLTALEIVPRNSPSLMRHIVADIQSFAEMNNMELNPAKCKDMIINFLHFNASVLQPIIIGASYVESVSSFKLLGVYITSDLTWSVHCEYIIKKSNRRLYALRKLKRSGVAPEDILRVYCAIIRSVLEYASAVFANLPITLSDDLERVQKRALAIIYPNCTYDDALKLAGIESLVLRRDAACKRFVETILPGNPLYPIVHSRPAPVEHGYNLRSDNIARNIRTRTDRFRKFVTIKYAI